MSGNIYSKPIMFTIVATVTILIGSIAMVFFPMMTAQMHPRLDNLVQFTPLELMGKDIYQREGCMYCHTQTVRPLKTEVMRYGEYSKAGEFAYDRPFLWGSKRTGPDLARIGLRLPAVPLYNQMRDPRATGKKSNMPAYAWLEDRSLDPASIKTRMDAQGFAYTDDEIKALEDKNDLDAIVAYLLWLGHAVKPAVAEAGAGPGAAIYAANCAGCHSDDGSGGAGPSLRDNTWLGVEGDVPDAKLVAIVTGGTGGGMPPYEGAFSDEELGALIEPVRSLAGGGSDSAGAQVFGTYCSGCHGADATGGYGPNLTDNVWLGKEGDISDDRIKSIVLKGTAGGMPTFEGAISSDELGAIVGFLRSIAK